IQTCDTGPAVEAVREIDDASSRTAGLAERAVVRALGADCHSPVGALATLDGTSVLIRAMAAREDGTQVQHLTVEGRVDEAVALGMVLGNRLRQALQTA
ncbi:MAG TPA: hypothetical protein VF221_09170, partial [Chloroflexota bacterium]